MSFWELFGLMATGMGLFASILGPWLTYAARQNGAATRALIRDTQAETRQLIEEMQAENRQLLERMDVRADERHREVIEAIRLMRA
jgi:hypothetical protein